MNLRLSASAPGPCGAALVLMLALALLGPLAPAHGATPWSSPLRPAVEQFLAAQTTGLPGTVRISLEAPASGELPACDGQVAPFVPAGTRLWGRVSVGVRCTGQPPWTRYLQAHIAVNASYYVAARQIEAGQPLTPADFTVRQGDLTALPASVVLDASALDGVIALNRITSGAPLRKEGLRAPAVVQNGQTVKMTAQGAGFVVSTEGKAMTSAAAGALVQVRLANGQLINGVVRPDGSVERALP